MAMRKRWQTGCDVSRMARGGTGTASRALKGCVPNDRNRGFTLIELLVVIAIISLLVSMLVPSLARAKILAENVLCRANLRGMGLAFTMYLVDSKKVYPDCSKWIFPGVSPPEEPDPDTLWFYLEELVGNEDMFSCKTGVSQNGAIYGKNTYVWMGGEADGAAPRRLAGARFDEIVNPSQMGLVWDRFNGGTTQSPHEEGPNVLFADGNVAAYPLEKYLDGYLWQDLY